MLEKLRGQWGNAGTKIICFNILTLEIKIIHKTSSRNNSTFGSPSPTKLRFTTGTLHWTTHWFICKINNNGKNFSENVSSICGLSVFFLVITTLDAGLFSRKY